MTRKHGDYAGCDSQCPIYRQQLQATQPASAVCEYRSDVAEFLMFKGCQALEVISAF